MHLNLIGDTKLIKKFQKDFQLITKISDQVMGKLHGQVNLIFCDDKIIQELNKTYRSKDKATDILTFTYYQGKTTSDDILGEIFLNANQAKRQAKEQKVPFSSEMYTLCIHGIVHLRGYDHEKEKDYRVMKLIEDKIKKLFTVRRKP